jgi:hypothetical protein
MATDHEKRDDHSGGVGVFGAMRGDCYYVGMTKNSATAHNTNIQCTVRMLSRWVLSARPRPPTKSCACAFITFLAWTISCSVDSS